MGNITAKANRSLGFLRRNLYACTKEIKNMAYKTLVRPILEYSSTVWDPHTQTLVKQIEAVQNRAARFVTGKYSRHLSVTAMKKDLNWEELETRRKVARLITFHQALAGQLAIPAREILRPVQRSSRHTTPKANNFTPIAANKNCYKQSFIPRTLVQWNSLPSHITTIEKKEEFKTAVRNYNNFY